MVRTPRAAALGCAFWQPSTIRPSLARFLTVSACRRGPLLLLRPARPTRRTPRILTVDRPPSPTCASRLDVFASGLRVAAFKSLCVPKFLFGIPFRMPPNPVLRGSVAASPPTPLRKTAFDSPMLLSILLCFGNDAHLHRQSSR